LRCDRKQSIEEQIIVLSPGCLLDAAVSMGSRPLILNPAEQLLNTQSLMAQMPHGSVIDPGGRQPVRVFLSVVRHIIRQSVENAWG